MNITGAFDASTEVDGLMKDDIEFTPPGMVRKVQVFTQACLIDAGGSAAVGVRAPAEKRGAE